METNTDTAGTECGLPHGLSTLLGLDIIKEAKQWTLARKHGNFYFTLVFTKKPFEFPAKTHVKPQEQAVRLNIADAGATTPSSYAQCLQADLYGKSTSTVSKDKTCTQEETADKVLDTPRPKKKRRRKRKSPSTRRRNRLRWLRWRSRKHSDHRLAPNPVPPCPGVPGTSKTHESTPDSESSQVESAVIRQVSSADPEHYLAHTTSHTDSERSVDLKQPTARRPSHPDSDSELYTPRSTGNDIHPDSASYLHHSPVSDKDYTPVIPKAKPEFEMHCFICDAADSSCKDGLKKCTRCWKAYYCGRACQVIHWPRHRLHCQPA